MLFSFCLTQAKFNILKEVGKRMFSVDSHNVITITRGDSASTVIFVNQGTLIEQVRYELQPNDALYIGVMEPHQKFEDAIIKYKLTDEDLNRDGDVVWSFKPTDTEYLEPGKYFYQIKLVRSNGQYVDTIVSKTPFYIQD